MERDFEEDEEQAAAEVSATLEVPGASGSIGAMTPRTAAKKKKKKKAKKKASAAELDLDMDNDDAAEQTRFAGIVKTPSASESGENHDLPVSPKKKRKSILHTNKRSHISVNLDALAEVDEDEESNESGGEERKGGDE